MSERVKTKGKKRNAALRFHAAGGRKAEEGKDGEKRCCRKGLTKRSDGMPVGQGAGGTSEKIKRIDDGPQTGQETEKAGEQKPVFG